MSNGGRRRPCWAVQARSRRRQACHLSPKLGRFLLVQGDAYTMWEPKGYMDSAAAAEAAAGGGGAADPYAGWEPKAFADAEEGGQEAAEAAAGPKQQQQEQQQLGQWQQQAGYTVSGSSVGSAKMAGVAVGWDSESCICAEMCVSQGTQGPITVTPSCMLRAL